MDYRSMTLEHQKQIKTAIDVLKVHYTAEERLEYIGAIAEIDMPKGIKHAQFFFQMADHNTFGLKKGDTYTDIDGSAIVSDKHGERRQTLFEYKFDTGDHEKIIKKFEESNQFENYMLLVMRDSSKTLNAVLAVHSSNKLHFPLSDEEKDAARVIKVYKPSDVKDQILSTHDYDGMSVAKFKELRRLEG